MQYGWVGPEQRMKDMADYARKGIARGRTMVGLTFADGVLLVAENHSRSLHKISEIYDRIAFAGVGKYNEFDQLRIAGIRAADIRGFSFSREDVDARSLAFSYAQMLGHVFTQEPKPLEVEILVAEIGLSGDPDDDRLFHILYDGTVMDEENFSVLGGDAETIATRMKEHYTPSASRRDALQAATAALAGPDRTLGAKELEVAELHRGNGRRSFRRIEGDELSALLT